MPFNFQTYYFLVAIVIASLKTSGNTQNIKYIMKYSCFLTPI